MRFNLRNRCWLDNFVSSFGHLQDSRWISFDERERDEGKINNSFSSSSYSFLKIFGAFLRRMFALAKFSMKIRELIHTFSKSRFGTHE